LGVLPIFNLSARVVCREAPLFRRGQDQIASRHSAIYVILRRHVTITSNDVSSRRQTDVTGNDIEVRRDLLFGSDVILIINIICFLHISVDIITITKPQLVVVIITAVFL
jgi:hypothetical protein